MIKQYLPTGVLLSEIMTNLYQFWLEEMCLNYIFTSFGYPAYTGQTKS